MYKGKPKVNVGGKDIGYDNLPAHWDVTVHYQKGSYHGNEVKLITQITVNESNFQGVVASISKNSVSIQLPVEGAEKKAVLKRFYLNKSFIDGIPEIVKTISKGDTVKIKSIGSPKKMFALGVKSMQISAK